jgi:probable addiction module antidote protein
MPKTAAHRTTPYDVTECLRTPEDMAAYLDAWLIDAPDDAAGIARALGDIARAKGMTQVAKDAGLSRESLCRALSPKGNPSFATVHEMARALGGEVACGSGAGPLSWAALQRKDAERLPDGVTLTGNTRLLRALPG